MPSNGPERADRPAFSKAAQFMLMVQTACLSSERFRRPYVAADELPTLLAAAFEACERIPTDVPAAIAARRFLAGRLGGSVARVDLLTPPAMNAPRTPPKPTASRSRPSPLPAPVAEPPATSPRSRKPIPRWAETPEQMRERIATDRKARDARNDELFVQRPTSQAALAAIGAASAGIAARDVMAAVPAMKRLEVTRMLKRLRNLGYLEVVGDRRHSVWKGTTKLRRMLSKSDRAPKAL